MSHASRHTVDSPHREVLKSNTLALQHHGQAHDLKVDTDTILRCRIICGIWLVSLLA